MYNLFTDERGSSELVRTEVPGQVSYSITKEMRLEVIIFMLEKLRFCNKWRITNSD